MNSPTNKPKRRSVNIIAAIITAVAVIIAAVIGLFSGFWTPSPGEINITTHVSDSTSMASVEGAKIILLLDGISHVEYSDGNGNFTFRVNAAKISNARLFVESSGYEIFDKNISLSKNLNVDVRLVSRDSNNRKIIVRVVDDGNNFPIEGAKVIFLANGKPYSETSDSNGIAIFTIEFTGETLDVDISVSTAEYDINHQQVTVRPDQVQDIRLTEGANKLDIVPFESSGTSPASATGNKLSYDQIVSGSIAQASQRDFYTFMGNSGDVVLITMVKTGGDLWPEIRLYDPAGNEVNIARSPAASVELREPLPVTGEYTILVVDGSGGTLTGQYNLNLQKLNSQN